MTANKPTAREGQEPAESSNKQPTHECRRCGHSWQYTGDAECPTCPSCGRKLTVDECLLPPTEYTIVDLTGEYGDGPRFDVDATIDTEEQSGEVIVRLGLTKAEAEGLWNQIRDDGHEYPDDARERVLAALEYKVHRAGRGN